MILQIINQLFILARTFKDSEVGVLKAVILLLIFQLPFSLFAQDSRLRLKRADVLENVTIGGEAVQILTGNVVFLKEDLVLIGERARFHQKAGLGFLVGTVKVTREEQTFTCDSLHIDSHNNILTGFSNAHIWDKTYDLKADTLFYYSDPDSGIALGNVKLIQDKQTVTARRITYKKSETTDGVSYTAEENVQIQDSLRVATCGLAHYKREQEKTLLQIKPEIRENGQVISGKEITLQYDESKLEFVFIPEQAHTVYHPSGYLEKEKTLEDTVEIIREAVDFADDMTSRSLKAYFVDGALDSMRLEGMATTLYHVFEDSIYQGKNLASGDTIRIKFSKGNLNRIFISGGSRGLYTPDTVAAEIDSPVEYASNHIDYHIPEEETDLHGEAQISYTDVDLSAGFVNVQWQTNLLKALPESDFDTLSPPVRPTLVEQGRDPMEGDMLLYNLETRRGKVTQGRTKVEDGYYTGYEIRNREDNIFYIDQSTYSTCDLPVPHFHFESAHMKMINDDKVVARPIVLYIAGIPIMALPLGIFPQQKGRRHSGWLMPGYGESRVRGQYLNGLGYFWAPNDYWDSKFTMSFADRQGITMKLQNNYRKRYGFSGGLRLENRQNFPAGLVKSEQDITGLLDNRRSDYVVNWHHNQTLRNDQTLRVNASYYSSGDYNRLTGVDPVTRLNQQAISNATYSKRWRKSNNSISFNVSSKTDLMVDQKIDTTSDFYQPPSRAGTQLDITTSTLPKMAFRHGQRKMFKQKGSKRSWYHNINYNYSSNFNNKRRTYYESEAYAVDDSTENYRWIAGGDGDGAVKTFMDYAMVHNMSFSAPQKFLRYITVSPSLSLKSGWVNKTFTGQIDTSGNVVKSEVAGFAARTTGSFGVSASTQFYGLFPVGIGSLNSIRHVMSPSISFSYTPDFSKALFGRDLGYFETITNDSITATIDRFSGTMVGGTSTGERQSMSLRLNNVFQAKTVKDGKERKINLFSWSMSTGYNFVAETFKLSQLRSSVRTNIAGILNLDLSMTHDFYKYDTNLGKRINSYRLTENGLPYPRLMNVQLSTGFRFSGTRLGASAKQSESTDTTKVVERLDEGTPSFSAKKSKGTGKLWSTSLSFSFSQNKANPLNPSQTFWISTNS
ncbi:MAG: putative LPS assembly protein LptD, partial [Candidatus Marinimicrobia bacterium]|nr:putative LPS assembly protein LptD [Candidatus Neomarinimicrobiota bacterium]